MIEENREYVFLSYCHEDWEEVARLRKDLTAGDIKVWWDDDILPGQSVKEAIHTAMAKSYAVILCLSIKSAARSRSGIYPEMSDAIEEFRRCPPETIYLIPVRLSECPIPALEIGGGRWLDSRMHIDLFPETTRSKNLPKLLAALQEARQAFDDHPGGHRLAVPQFSNEITSDTPRSFMVAPFDDNSPEGNQGHVANSIVSYLIDRLMGFVSSLRVADKQATKAFKLYNGQYLTYAAEMGIQYFVEGEVQLKGNGQYEVTFRLLEVEIKRLKKVWGDTITAATISDAREAVALKVVEKLELDSSTDKEGKPEEKLSESPDAVDLFLRGVEYSDPQTKEGLLSALPLYRRALQLDPHFWNAHCEAAEALALLHRSYAQDPSYLLDAEQHLEQALKIKPDCIRALSIRSAIQLRRGWQAEKDFNFQAEALAKKVIELDPGNPESHFGLGFVFEQTKQPTRAIASYEVSIAKRADFLNAHWRLVLCYDKAHSIDERVEAAGRALLHFQSYLARAAKDELAQSRYALLLFHANREVEAEQALSKLALTSDSRKRDGQSLYNLGCLSCLLGKGDEAKLDGAMEFLREADKEGFSSFETFRDDPDLDPLRHRDDFKSFLEQLSLS